jgi:hypothetical protein
MIDMAKSDLIVSDLLLAGSRASETGKGRCLARPFSLRAWAPLFRLLAFSIALLLLTVRLGSFTEEAFVTPVQDAIFDVAFISDADHSLPTKVIKSQRSLDCDLPLCQASAPPQVLILAVLPVYVPPLSSDENPCEIFIPPEGFSWSLSRV